MAMLLWTPDSGTQLRQLLGSSTPDGMTPLLIECDSAVDLHFQQDGPGSWRVIDCAVTQGMTDMTAVAFTVTPAPGPIAMIGMGAFMVCKRRRRNG
jgi:hypothetical protein